MATDRKKSFLESILFLLLLGLLAGAIGGAGVGFIQMRAATSASSSSTGGK